MVKQVERMDVPAREASSDAGATPLHHGKHPTRAPAAQPFEAGPRGQLWLNDYAEKIHMLGSLRALRAAFMHDHWPLFTETSPRFACDSLKLLSALSDVRVVIEDDEQNA